MTALPSRLVFCAALLAATANAACGSSPESSSSAPLSPVNDPAAHPAWLVGGWHVSSSSDSVSSTQTYHFNADGRGSWSIATVYTYSGITDKDSHDLTWRFQAPSTLVINDVPYALDVSAGCRQMTMAEVMWHGSPREGTCPTNAAPLTATEESFVGTWKIDAPPAGDLSLDTAHGSFYLTEDRRLSLDLHLSFKSTWETQTIAESGEPWQATDDGLLTCPTDDGKSQLALRLTRKGDALELCYGAIGCYLGHK